ncbi:hypothetical protein Tco_1546637 [Tanacetum coccineum]
MSGRRNTRNTNTSTTNEDQPNDLEGMVAQQLNAALPNLEFYGNEGAVGLLSWIEGMESKLHINKCSDNSKVEYAACLLHGRATNDRPVLTCFECESRDHLRNTCPKLNRALGQGRNRLIPALAIEGNLNWRNNDNQTHGKAFIMGATEAGQNPNVMTDLVPGETPIAKSPYRLAPTEMQELSNQSKSSKIRVLFDLAVHHGENSCYSSRRRMVHFECA